VHNPTFHSTAIAALPCGHAGAQSYNQSSTARPRRPGKHVNFGVICQHYGMCQVLQVLTDT
jgi:hypothetical protein